MTLSVSNISFEYAQDISVLRNVSIEIGGGEVVALVGPSGCGKSTLLHCIAGLLSPDSGSIVVGGRTVTQVKPHERGIGIMMQEQPLYEHMTVEQNIAFPLLAKGIKEDVSILVNQLELTDIAKQLVSKCSGGERRRIAFGRAIVTSPSVLLLDEPFVSLDDELRSAIQERIRSAHITTLLVTHEQQDIISDRTISMEELC